MSCVHTLNAIFAATARARRKVTRSGRFNRDRAARPLFKSIDAYWQRQIEAMMSHLASTGGFAAIQRRTRVARIARDPRLVKAISDADRVLLQNLLQGINLYGNAERVLGEIMKSSTITTFEEAAKFALGQLGAKGVDFELRNGVIREKLESRTEAAIFATRNHIDQAFDTIIERFYERGDNPYDQSFVRQIQKDLGYQTEAQAKRFALTETGIAAELAQVESYRRNGVEQKQWNITGDNTRPSHASVAGEIIPIRAKFDLDGIAADHPLDPDLPPSELVNCHCWLSPVMGDDFELGAQLWEGQ